MMRRTIFLVLATALFVFQGFAASFSVTSLKVQGLDQPLTIEDERPLFSWQMQSDNKGQQQTAYQIVLYRELDGKAIWDSGKIMGGLSTNIRYSGVGLRPESAYKWDLTVWDQDGDSRSASSRFETGLMNSSESAWDGAEWIGSKELILDAASHQYFEISADFKINSGDKMSFVFGANDFRLTDAFQNAYNLAGENYVRVELDLSGVGSAKGAVLNIYRVGYAAGDSADVPFVSVNKEAFPETNINTIYTTATKNNQHSIRILVEAGQVKFILDGQDLITAPAPMRFRPGSGGGHVVGSATVAQSNASNILVNPWGAGGNMNSLPHIAEIGFPALPSYDVTFTNFKIKNRGQAVDDVVFDSRNYNIFQGLPGVTLSGQEIRVANRSNSMLLETVDPSHTGVTMLRTNFNTADGKRIRSAKLYATAMGTIEMFINGERVGEDWFVPGNSQYRETLSYAAYDVTSLLNSGSNSMGAIVAAGWWRDYLTFTISNYNFYGDYEAFLARLVITYEDGTKEVVVTNDDTWKVFKEGPIRYGNFFQGERYDASKEAAVSVNGNVRGWATAAYNDSAWKRPDLIEKQPWIDFEIKARFDPMVREVERLKALQVMPVNSADGHTYTYDMGANMVGVPSVKIPAGWLKKGDVVIFRFGEQLYPGFEGDDAYYVEQYGANGVRNVAGRPLFETYRAAMNAHIYIADSDREVTIMPTTTFTGYQYVQITLPSHSGPLPLANVEGVVLSSDDLQSGTYKAVTADGRTGELVNQLFRNIQRSQLGNFFTLPTDCPQRNERMGWTGDAQAYVRTGTYNSNVRNFFRQWMVSLRDDQGIGNDTIPRGGIGNAVPTYNKEDATSFPDGTTWAAAVCQVPWQLYLQYGDTQTIEENMEAMMDWLNGMDYYDFSPEYTYLSAKTTGLADWLSMDSRTTSDIMNNAIYIYMMEATSIMADVIGRTDYADLLRYRRERAIDEFYQVYVDPVTKKTRNRDGEIMHTQSSYAVPLNFNVFREDYIPTAAAFLAELAKNPSASGDGSREWMPYTITTGFAGTPNILPALSRTGYSDEAFRMFTCTDYTSWLYPVTMGATSIWERWNGYEGAFGPNNSNSMNSFNHFALGAVGQWIYEYQMGITTDRENPKNGYKHFILQPGVGADFTSLEGSYDSEYGRITSSYTADGNGKITSYTTVVPANTTATLYLPVEVSGSVSGQGVQFVGMTTNNGVRCAQVELTSGKFTFNVNNGRLTVN